MIRLLRLDHDRWFRTDTSTLAPATMMVVGASVLMAWNRFGGLVVEAPRAFARLTLVGIYGWLGLSGAVWLLSRPISPADRSFLPTLVTIGLAHLPPLLFGVVIFVATGLLQVQGPGLVTAVFVFGFWFPAVLTAASRTTFGIGLRQAAIVIAVPYLAWLALVGRHLLLQVRHLL